MPLFPPPEPTVSCFDDLDFFKDFENEFPVIVYYDAQTSKSDILTEPILNPQHIEEVNDKKSLYECDEEEQNFLNFNDLFPFDVIYPNDSKSGKDNDDDKVDMEHSSGDLPVKLLLYVQMDDPNITIEEYIRLVEEKARRHVRCITGKLLRMLFVRAMCAGVIYCIEVCTEECAEVDRRLSISKEALGAFRKSKPTAKNSDDILVCCVENTVEDRLMNSGASFHATYCKEELERFKLCFGKVGLVDDKTLDIVGVRDVVLKTSFGTSRTLKDVRYIPGLKDKHQRLGDMSMIGMNMLASKGNVLDVRKVDIYFCKPGGLGKKKKFSIMMSEKTRKLQRVAYYRGGMVREGYKSHTLKGNDSDEVRYSFRDTKSHQVIRSRDITFVDSIYKARSATDSSSLTKLIQKSQVVLVDILENLAENHSIVAEHGLSSKITQSPSGSSNTSEGSKNSGSFKDSGRSYEEYSKHGASSKEGGSETLHVRRSTKESGLQ
nr:retrovirus-related Pol polyprotein from transposon TNT 1-94 [Tanacetum cinerariifolium]